MTPQRNRVLVTGAAGQLGTVLSGAFSHAGYCVLPLDRAKLDITESDRVRTTVRELQPNVIVNCSAYNAVDAAETQAVSAFAINAHGPAALAAAAAEVGAVLVHYSTDFVFDGTSSTPYIEDDAPNPLSIYGASKLAGENAVRRSNQHYILRVESLFGGTTRTGSRTTVDFMMENLAQGKEVRAAIDRTVSPSYVRDVVRATLALVSASGPYGTYHCVASGHATWYEVALEIAALIGAPALVTGVSTADLPTVAKRPQFCALSNRKLRNVGIVMPSWRAVLRAHLAARRHRIAEPDKQIGVQVA